MPSRFCGKCGNVQTGDMYCHTCEQILPWTEFYFRHDDKPGEEQRYRSHCLVCERDRKAQRDKFNNKELFVIFSNAIKKSLLPFMNTTPMTEQEWLNTCRYFKGCAMCGKHDIQIRQFFIPRKEGGRYVAGNMIPMDPECANMFRLKGAIDPLHLKRIRTHELDLERLDTIYEFIREQKWR